MIDRIEKELCTGCDACFNICPVNCIDMAVDEMGFKYPSVDYERCIKCKKCISTCPSYNKPNLSTKWKEPKVYAAWSLDEETRFTSTSGGLFSELAGKVVEEGGLVVGAIYNQKHLVEHYITDNIDGIKKLKQSKYVQSEIGNVFKHIKEKLDTGKTVAFCGSPCQVAGLLNFLNKPYSNLITFDFVCRGTNSPKAYLKYIEMLEEKYKSKVKKVWFKNKIYGWNRFSTFIQFNDGKTYIRDRYHDLYMRGYIEENLYIRPCCSECKYKAFPRIADITMGDFWGVGLSDANLDTNKGTSLIMINSEKGLNLFQSININIYDKESDLETAVNGNPAIIKSTIRNPKSDQFLGMLDEYSFNVCFKKCVKSNYLRRIKRKIYNIARTVKKVLKIYESNK